MTPDKLRFRIETHPQAPEASQVIWEQYRFTVLTPQMIRLEYHPEARFEDRATQTVWNRNFDTPDFEVKETEETLEIVTTAVHLLFHKERGGFTKHNLRIEPIGNYSLYHSTWYFGEQPETLKGTARTLDKVDGAVELEEGLMNERGFSLIDDSRSMIVKTDGWVEERSKDAVDVYYLGYGRDYLGTLRAYHQLTGKTPLLPRYALGNWWSRYYPYSEKEYKELMNRFESEGYPFSVAVIDMDWHVTDVPPEYGSGWTGYTWNRELFPDPAEFLGWLHEKGLHTTLNLHPANGVQPHEEMYEEMGRVLDVDTEKKEPIDFDIADPAFLHAYFDYLHHPHEEAGVDFWWIDWQQGSVTKVPGLDPLWMLNHYHFLDHGREEKRPMIFSRYAGLGSHRYPVGFSGDTVVSWASLDFQPYFTATASNVGYNWWSHDIGGHKDGVKDNELFVRWVQFGVFSPINRLHATSGLFHGKEPWRYGKEAAGIIREFLQLRHRLIPYVYTMNVYTHEDDLPLVQPMYYHHPWAEEAYEVPNQYYFGTQLLVAPITKKMDPTFSLGHVKVWLPKGIWWDFFTGRVYEGDQMMDMYRPLAQVPVLAKAGGIVPLDQTAENKPANPEKMDIRIFAGANGQFKLIEDDGLRKEPAYASTKMSLRWKGEGGTTFGIQKPEGNMDALPNERSFRLTFVGFDVKEIPTVRVNGKGVDAEVSTDDEWYIIDLPAYPIDSEYQVQFSDAAIRGNDVEKELFAFLDGAELPIPLKEAIFKTVKKGRTPARIASGLHALELDHQLSGALSEILWAYLA